MDKIGVPLAWVPLTTVKGGAGRPLPGRLVGRATSPLTCTDGSCRFLWVLVLQQPVWLPLVVSGRRETSSPALLPAPGGRSADLPDGDPLVFTRSIAFIVLVFDSVRVNQDRPGPSPDRILVAQLTGTAGRHARWRELTAAEEAAAVAELRELAAGRADLLAEVAGVFQGASEDEPGEPRSCAAKPEPTSVPDRDRSSVTPLHDRWRVTHHPPHRRDPEPPDRGGECPAREDQIHLPNGWRTASMSLPA